MGSDDKRESKETERSISKTKDEKFSFGMDVESSKQTTKTSKQS